jgi:hypothetical protein
MVAMHHFQRWRANILRAKTRQEVLQVVRDYVACVLPSEMLKLPVTSQVALTDAPADLAGAAVTLRRDELRFSGDEETSALMNEMSQTFTAASARIAQIESVPGIFMESFSPAE